MRQNVDAKNREDAALRAAGKPVAASGPSPGVRDVRWLKPVYPGDTITFISEIVGKREVSRPGYGLVTTATTGINQHGEPVYSAQGAVFVERRSK
jgi:acyl dehydratase